MKSKDKNFRCSCDGVVQEYSGIQKTFLFLVSFAFGEGATIIDCLKSMNPFMSDIF